MKKETLYLIGGSGFIGKNLVRCLSPFYGITVFDKYTENLRNNGRMRVKFDKWLVHIPFLCYLTILLNLAEGAVYGGY